MYNLTELLFTILEGFIFITSYSILSNQKKFIFESSLKTIFFTFIFTVYAFWATYFIPLGIHSIVITLFTILTFTFIFRGTIIKTILKSIAIFLSFSVVEISISVVTIFIFNTPIGILLENDTYVFVCSIIVKAIEFTIIYILYKINFHIPWLNDNNDNSQSRIRQILLLISAFLFFMVSSTIFITTNSLNSSNIIIFNIFSFVIYIVLIFAVIIAFKEGSKLEIIQFASELKKENLQQLIEFNEMVAKERHEYKNHLNTIYGLCTLNKPDLNEKIKQYINNYANNSETRNLAVDSGNDFVDAIINVKYNNALIKGVEVIPDFSIPLSVANIDENVAVTIISNIIENAFESIVLDQQEKKYIRIQTYIENDTYYISISNNGPMISEADKKKIFSAGFSTKDNSTKKRGFGLSIVKTQVESSGGIIYINSTEEVTEFLISLKIKSEQAVS